MLEVLEWSGTATGILGALLLAMNNRWSGWGFAAFLTSNGFWVAYGIQAQAAGLVTMQIVFTVTSLIGVWRWLVQPRLAPATASPATEAGNLSN